MSDDTTKFALEQALMAILAATSRLSAEDWRVLASRLHAIHAVMSGLELLQGIDQTDAACTILAARQDHAEFIQYFDELLAAYGMGDVERAQVRAVISDPFNALVAEHEVTLASAIAARNTGEIDA